MEGRSYFEHESFLCQIELQICIPKIVISIPTEMLFLICLEGGGAVLSEFRLL